MGCQFCKPEQKDHFNDYSNKYSAKSTDEYLNYIRLLGEDFINSKIQKVHEKIKKNYLKQNKHQIVDETIKDSQQHIKIWAEFQDQQNTSYKIQNIYLETDLVFTPQMYNLYNINESMTNAFGSAKYRLLDYTINNDTAVLICHTKTSKQWLFEERNFVIVRILRLLDDGSILEFQQSIHLNKLKSCQNFQNFSEKLKNLGTIHESYIYYSNAFDSPKIFQYYKVDLLQSFTLRVAKTFIKQKIIKFYKKQNKKIVAFVLTFREWFKLIWFTSSQKNFEKMFKANLIILKNSEFDLRKFNQKEIIEFNQQTENQKLKYQSLRRLNTDVESTKEEQQNEMEIFGDTPFNELVLQKCNTEKH